MAPSEMTAAEVGDLRALLGEQASGLTDEQLRASVSEETVRAAKDFGITRDDVEAARAELRAAAKDPESVDDLVALESLVVREMKIDGEYNDDSSQNAKAMDESVQALRTLEELNLRLDRDKSAEHEAEEVEMTMAE